MVELLRNRMIYTASNVMGATVHDVDKLEEFRKVMQIDTDRGEVEIASMPLRIAADGEGIATEVLRFRSIYAIKGLERLPCLFHCYGRIQ
jgi:hypothetical protein